MTAINIFLQEKRAVVMTDALFIDFRTGRPVMIQDKCAVAPGTAMVVAARGDWRVPQGIAADLARYYANIDQLIEDEGDSVRSLYDAWLHGSGLEVMFAPVQIMVVGWSEEFGRPRGALVHLADTWAFAEIDPAEGMAAPLPDDRELDRLAALGVEPGSDWDLLSFDPLAHGVPFMEAQRRMKLPLPNGTGRQVHSVGGHILLTEVTADGVRQEIIHRWEDSLGEPIAPAGFKPPARIAPTPPANMSRQQRRAWEKRNGKVSA